MDISEGKSSGDRTETVSDEGNTGRFRNGSRAASDDATYAAKATAFPRSDIGEKPIFVRHSDIPNASNNMPTGEEMFLNLAKITDVSNISGIQKIGGLWRVYLKEKESRITVISEGLKMRGVKVPVFDTNPFLKSGNENVWRVTVKDIPLSVADSVIVHELEGMKCKVAGKIVRQKLRMNGQLTNCLNGDRVLYIEPRPIPLDRHVKIASFCARIFHDGQTTVSQATCSRCLATGHHASSCTKPFVCRTCKQPGHKSYECPASRDQWNKESGATDRSGNNSANRQDDDENTQPASSTGHHASTCTEPCVCRKCSQPGHKSHECTASRDQWNKESGASDRRGYINSANRQDDEITQPAPRIVNASEGKADAQSKISKQPDPRRRKQDTKTQQNLKEIWSRTEHAHNVDRESDSTESASFGDESEYDDSNAFDSLQESVPREQMKKKRKRRKKGSPKMKRNEKTEFQGKNDKHI